MDIDFANSKILIDEVLKSSDFEKTYKIFFSLLDGSRKGPFIQKIIFKQDNLGDVYRQLHKVGCSNKSDGFANIPVVYSYETRDNFATIIQEYIDGQTLDEYAKSNKVDHEFVHMVFVDVCKAINVLHKELHPAVIHRDIKPSNIIVSNNKAFLIDFGIARNYNDELNCDTQHLGTVGYAPPEQFGFAQTDERSDIYSLGKVLDFMLINSSISHNEQAPYKAIVSKACALDPKDRFCNVDDLLESFLSISNGNLNTTTDFESSEIISSAIKHNISHSPGLRLKKSEHPWCELFGRSKFFYRLALVWNLILSLFFLLLMVSIINSAWIDPLKLNITTPIQSLVFFVALFFFFDIPLLLIFLIKQPIRKVFTKLPYFRVWHYILFGVGCFVVLLIIVGIFNLI